MDYADSTTSVNEVGKKREALLCFLQSLCPETQLKKECLFFMTTLMGAKEI